MAKKKGIPVSKIFEVVQDVQSASARSGEQVKVEVLVGAGAHPEHVEALKKAFMPETAKASVLVWDLASRAQVAPDADTDLVVIAVGTQGSMAAQVALRCVEQDDPVPCALVVPTALEAPHITEGAEQYIDIVAATESDAVTEKLAESISHSPKRILLARSFPFCRKAVASALIQESAFANAGVGAISFIPNADLPVMLATQEKLALDLMNVYGKDISAQTAVDLALVAGAGFAYRALARSVSSSLPGLGWALKGAIGYGGTLISGKGVEAHITGELPIDPSRIAAAISGLRNAKATGEDKDEEPIIIPLLAQGTQEGTADSGYIEIG